LRQQFAVRAAVDEARYQDGSEALLLLVRVRNRGVLCTDLEPFVMRRGKYDSVAAEVLKRPLAFYDKVRESLPFEKAA